MASKPAVDLVVIGAGAAGLFAATRAAQRGRKVLLIEKNTKPGVKILMSGGTRCNLTHATDRRGIADAFCRDQARFLRSPLAALGPDELVDFFHQEGLETKTESTGKVFPRSNRALDVQRTLLAVLQKSGARLKLGDPVSAISRSQDEFRVVTASRTIDCRTLIIATGGQSYPGCGTTGDGYAWAKSLGHSIVPPRPALAPLKTSNRWAQELAGITINDVRLSLTRPDAKKALDVRHGSLLFTHFGLSGPAAMDISREVTCYPRDGGLHLECDFLPMVAEHELQDRLAAVDGRRHVARLVAEWLPRRLADQLITQAKIPADRTGSEFSRHERHLLVDQLKRCRFQSTGTLGFAKAEVTAGGISLDEVDSRDMQSRVVPRLFLVGEVLDIDGPIGGYNFQAAFSTGWLAGSSV